MQTDFFEPDPHAFPHQHPEAMQQQQHNEHLQHMQLQEVQRQYRTHQHQMQAAHGLARGEIQQTAISGAQLRPSVIGQSPRRPSQSHHSQPNSSHQLQLQQLRQPQLELPLHEQLDHPLYVHFKEQHALDAEEDALVVEGLTVGMSWSDISAALPTRSLVDLQQRHSTRKLSQNDRSAARSQQVQERAQSRAQARARVEAARLATEEQERLAAQAEGEEEALPPSPPPDAAQDRGFGWRGGPKLIGDERVTLRRRLSSPPSALQLAAFHNLPDLSDVRFFQKADVVDPDQENGGEMFAFDLDDPVHGACFNMGDDGRGGTLISWSRLHALYILSDGTRWAEHSDFVDRSDLEELGRISSREVSHLLPETDSTRELFGKAGRQHTRLSATEYQCWVYDQKLPETLAGGVDPSDAFFTRTTFDPQTLQSV